MNIVLIVLLIIGGFGWAQAATYYVAPTGSNNNSGTISAPFATLQKGHDVAVAGDTIYMRGGTYKFSSQTTITRDGTSGNLIKVFNYPVEVPIIDAVNQPVGSMGIYLNGANWWQIKGLEIKNAAIGMSIENSNNNTIESNNVHHNGRSSSDGRGIRVMYSSANNLLLNNDSHHNRDTQVSNADGFLISTTGTGNVLRGNRTWRNSDDGFDFFCAMNGAICANTLLESNWAFENGFDDNLKPLGDGNGFKLGGIRPNTTGKSGGHTLNNNLSWKNKSGGFDNNCSSDTASECKPNILNNNTAWSNGSSNYIFWTNPSTFRNNINFGTLGKITGSATFNSWTLPVTVTSADFASMTDTCARGVRQPSGALPNCSFLHLVTGSDLIDKGTNVGIPYTGTAPDLGAYEFFAAEPPPPPPPPTCTQTTLNVSGAVSDGGFSWQVVHNFGTPPDVTVGATTSKLRVFENGVEIGPAHSLHVDISNLGAGRFSHWFGTEESLRLSATNNSNVKTNGRTYSTCIGQ